MGAYIGSVLVDVCRSHRSEVDSTSEQDKDTTNICNNHITTDLIIH